MARPRRRHPALAGIDEQALAEFRAGLRRRYTDEQILDELRASASAARALADDARVRRRPRGGRAPADGDRALRHLERRQARRRPAPAALHQPRGAARSSCASSGRSSAGRRPCATSRRTAARWRRSRSSGTRSARSRRRSRRPGFDVPVGEERLERAVARRGRARAGARPAAEDGGLEGRATRATRRCCRSGRSTGMVDVAAGRVVGVPVPRARAAARGGRRGRARRDARSAEAASRAR